MRKVCNKKRRNRRGLAGRGRANVRGADKRENRKRGASNDVV